MEKNGGKEITAADCPDCLVYPGRYTRNNPTGIVEDKKQWIEGKVLEWVKLMSQNDKYEATHTANKVKRLKRYLEKVRGLHETPRVLLLEAERKLGDIQREVDDEMDVENIQEYGDGTRCEVELEIEKFMRMSDSDLFENRQECDLPHFLLESDRYFKRKQEFISKYVEDLPNSQEILNSLSQMPTIVIQSKNLKERIDHFSKKDKSKVRLFKTITDTIDKIDMSTQAGRDQIRILVAACWDHRFGPPEIECLLED